MECGHRTKTAALLQDRRSGFPPPRCKAQLGSWGAGEGGRRHLKRCYLGCKHYPELTASATEAPCRSRLPGVRTIAVVRTGRKLYPPRRKPRAFISSAAPGRFAEPHTHHLIPSQVSLQPRRAAFCARDRSRSRVSNTGTCSLRSRSPDPV